MGQIWRVATRDGDWAIKELTGQPDIDAVEAAAMLGEAAAAVGIAVPLPRRTPGGELAISVDSVWYRAHPWVDVGQPHRAPVSTSVAAQIGTVLGKLHRVAPTRSGLPDAWYRLAPTEDDWRALSVRAAHRGALWAPQLDRLVPTLAAVAAFVNEVRPGVLRLCHLDLDTTNVLPERAHGRLVVLDWDDVAPGDPAQELATLLVDWTRAGDAFRRQPASALLAAYRDHGGTLPSPSEDLFAAMAARTLNFLVAMAAAVLDGPDEYRGFALDKLTKLLATPPRLDAIASLTSSWAALVV